MALIELAIVEAIASGSLYLGMRKVDERAQVKDSLMKWQLEGVATPVIDGVLQHEAGSAETGRERFLATQS